MDFAKLTLSNYTARELSWLRTEVALYRHANRARY
jgi:hypothetical protein